MRLIKRYYKGARRRVLGIKHGAPNPWATHMPVLMALARAQPIRSVLELGSGPFSTSLFLNRAAFPDLERLVSFEDDAEWAQVVQNAAQGDVRLDYRLVPSVPQAVPMDVHDYDLVFIDDSQVPEDRARTIRAVADRGPTGIVAIHDFEEPQYRRAARAYDRRRVFRTFTPQVGICWNRCSAPEVRARVDEAQAMVEAARHLDVDDVESWLANFRH